MKIIFSNYHYALKELFVMAASVAAIAVGIFRLGRLNAWPPN